MKKTVMLLSAALMALSVSTAVFADWKQAEDGRWWYENPDGSYTVNGWQHIEGKDYYFDSQGYLLVDTVTPDGYRVGPDGAWDGGSAGQSSGQSHEWIQTTLSGTKTYNDISYAVPTEWYSTSAASGGMYYYPYTDHADAVVYVYSNDIGVSLSDSQLRTAYEALVKGAAEGDMGNVSSFEMITIAGQSGAKARLNVKGIDTILYVLAYGRNYYCFMFGEKNVLSANMIRFAGEFADKITINGTDVKPVDNVIVGNNVGRYKTSGSSDSGKSSSKTSSGSKSTSKYEQIYNTYKKKIEASSGDVSTLAEICTEGVEKMAEYYLKSGGSYSTYEKWAEKLYDVYEKKAAKSFY